MTTINNNHDTTRDQYISHKLYLEKRTGNRYYNLGYMTYKGIVSNPQTIVADEENLKNAITNFEVALLFDKNDINSTVLKNELCDKYGPNGTIDPGRITTLNLSKNGAGSYKTEAKKIYRNCKC
jgi:hypothetical protein|tara:strand:+ start:1517 stop:1888 length:372 start_codon:yes stop_codon:yes gene_type:complete